MHKISAKILKLKQNIPNEVVWVMKDDSFINLIYFLSEENIVIPCNLLSKKELNQKTSFNKIIEQNKQNDDNNIKSNINIENNNLENKQRITKKIISRKNEKIINGGVFNNDMNSNIMNNINNINNNIISNNSKLINKSISQNKTINKQSFRKNLNQSLNNLGTSNSINSNLNTDLIKKKEIKDISSPIKFESESDKIINNIKNLNKSFALSETPKKENISNRLMDSTNLTNSILNFSDCSSITTNRNDKLNLSVNTIDTCDLQNAKNIDYKILANNERIIESDNIYSKKYLSGLNPTDYEYDTFCHAIIKTGLNEGKITLSKYSENFPAPCEHELCSKLPSFEPRVLNYYQNREKTNKLDIKQEATSHLVFPLGIKLCVEQDFHNQNIGCEPLINTIYNEKGDLYYIASLTIFRKISIKNYNKLFSINPIDVYNQSKFGQSAKNNNVNISNNSENKNNQNAFKIANKNELNNSNDYLKFNPNDFLYIPECISLVSRFPYFNQLSICLKTIINMRRQIINGDNNQKIENDISNFINHLINQIPIASNKYNIFFYTPLNIEPIILYNPFLYNFGNFTCQNIFSYLSIDNIITIFLLILLEQKIIFVDINHIKLSSITFFFLNLIYPLTWVNTYQPLLSLSTIRYIQSITPFIMGGNENLILYAYSKKYIIYNESLDNIDKSNILFVSLSNNLISCDCYNLIMNKKGQNRKQILKYLNLPDMPKSFEKKLINHLNEIEKIEDLKKMNEKIKTFFCRMMVFILDDYKDYFVYSKEKYIFNKDNYLMNKKEEKKLFYKELLATQLFTQFIFNENEYYKQRKTQTKKIKMKNKTYGILHEESYKDNTFFMKNKNKIDELMIMIKQKRKERIKNSIKSAKKIVKNIGQLFYGTNDNKNEEKDLSIKKSVKKNESTFIKKKKKEKNYNIMLMPYFIEEPKDLLLDSEKYDYIQNKLNSLITIDNQLNQINNYKNKYIFDFNQKFDLKSIIDDKTRYFIGTLNQEETKQEKNNEANLKIDSNINNKLNGKNNINNNNLMTGENKDESSYKEKIILWHKNICLSSNKRKISYELNITEELNVAKNRKFFVKLISQNYKTLFDIRENNQNFLSNEGFIELLQKIQFILSKINYEEYKIGKILTLICFKYYTYVDENKNNKFYLYNKYVELFTPCELWLNHIFWKTWFDEDISYVEKEFNLSNDNDYSSELNKSNEEENELIEYNEENNNLSIEYRLLTKIMKVMNDLKLEESFVNKIIFDDLAPNYIEEKELNHFKEKYS